MAPETVMIAGDCGPGLRERVTQYVEKVEGTNLYLLRAIEGTVDSLSTICTYVSAETTEANRLSKTVREFGDEVGVIDPDDRLTKALGGLLDGLQSFHAVLKEKRGVALKAPELVRTGYRATIVEAYDKAIECVHELFDAVSELRTVEMEHDADRSNVVGSFSSAKDLLAALKQ